MLIITYAIVLGEQLTSHLYVTSMFRRQLYLWCGWTYIMTFGNKQIMWYQYVLLNWPLILRHVAIILYWLTCRCLTDARSTFSTHQHHHIIIVVIVVIISCFIDFFSHIQIHHRLHCFFPRQTTPRDK